MGQKRQSKTMYIGLLFLAALIVAGGTAYWYLKELIKPANPGDTTAKTLTIASGQGFRATSEQLYTEKLIKSPYSLRIAYYLNGQKNAIQAGTFTLNPAMSAAEILSTLSHGRNDIQVTLLEGWRREQIADELAKNFSSFNKAQFLKLTESKEGYLFPDTYTFPATATETQIIEKLEDTLNKKIDDSLQSAIKKSKYSLPQILTMASIVEREARSDQSRRMVAGILWKRLENNWPLQADATLQYAKGYNKTAHDWWVPPTAVDKEIKSPYNTYKNPGLPPGPICAPSLSSIKAAIMPQASNYWFYLTADGQMYYAETADQHNANVAKYLR